jgi:SAM-dependent methyltransferase
MIILYPAVHVVEARRFPMAQSIQPVRFGQLQDATREWFALLAGMQLDLFTPLDTGSLSAPELATVLSVDADKLSLLLYALVVAGFLTVQDGRFANTDEAATFLVCGKPGYIGSAHTFLAELGEAGLKTAKSVRTGIPQAHFGDCRRLLDAAGGSGGASIALLERWPELHATIAELPNVVSIAERFVADAGLRDRIAVVAVDLLSEAVPGSFDVAVVSQLIQVLSARNARLALRNIAHSLRPGGVAYLINRVLDDSRLTPEGSVRANVIFLNFYDGGQAHPEGEYRAWLSEAGFVEIVREEGINGMDLIRARKAG